ncbi:DUF349 domain-containing protein [Myroides sp. LJL115]
MHNQSNDNLQELADGQNNQSNTTKDTTLASITAVNAEIGEEQELSSAQIIVDNLDYEQMDLASLSNVLKDLTENHPIKNIRDNIEQIKKSFIQKYDDLLEQKRDAFLQNNPDALESDFEFKCAPKEQFDHYYKLYKHKRNTYRQELEARLQANLENRLQIIEKIKDIVEDKTSTKVSIKQLNELRDQWSKAGSIPKDKYEDIWSNYHFQVERFYDLLQLDNETRQLDFKHNLEQKQRLVQRAKDLLEKSDVIAAFNELQILHRTWKEDIGPVSREVRDQVWKEFFEATKALYAKRELILDQLRQVERENLHAKVAIISQIDQLSKQDFDSHGAWQREIKKVEQLRAKYYTIGKVPNENSDEVWDLFKLATRNFNTQKNNFYKHLKKEQQANYIKKTALLEKAMELKDSTDFAMATPIMKKIQLQWREIGHVPKKHSDKLWKLFKSTCNHYFENLHQHAAKTLKEEESSFTRKKEYLQLLKSFELSGDHKADLAEIKNHIKNWKSIGKVPDNKRFIEGKFNRLLDTFFAKLNLSRRETEQVKFKNRLESILDSNDTRKLQNEAVFIQRKIEELHNNTLQLENNLAYIQNPAPNNPLVMEVHKNIYKLKEETKIWEDKLNKIRNLEND